jgi:tetratricopeptide (TPR) repeat protein
MLSPRLLKPPDLNIDQNETASFLSLNQEVWQFLLAFLRMSANFKFAFAEINFPPDSDILIKELMSCSEGEGLQFLVVNLDSPDLLFVLEELKKSVATVHQEIDKKLVLIVKGMEKSIRTNKDFPAVLTNLNYARDNFPLALPYPILFLLPEYAVNRLAQFAPDFWSWTTTNFKFQTTERVLNWAMQQTNSSPAKNRVYTKSEQSARIDLLERLLQEYPEDVASTLPTRREILGQLGAVHQSIRDFQTAEKYFQESLDLSIELKDKPGEANAFYQLGSIFYELREFDEAMWSLRKSLSISESIENRQSTAGNYHLLGSVALELRKWDDARYNYQQALAILVELANRYAQANTYNQLGLVAQELREWDDARHNYLQALAIKVEFADRYSQAVTYHRLGRVAQELREWDDARHNYLQALAILVEFADRYSQASTYNQLGIVAQNLREWDDARHNYQQALAIYVEFADRYSQATTYHNLGIVAQNLREWDDARHNYQQALAIYVEFADRYSQARTYYQLGRLAEDEGCLEDAISNFTISMEICTEFQDEYLRNIAQSSLDRVQKRLDLSKVRGGFVKSTQIQKYGS